MTPQEWSETLPQTWLFPEAACRRWNQCQQIRSCQHACGCVRLFGHAGVGAVGRRPARICLQKHVVLVEFAGRLRGAAESVAVGPIRIAWIFPRGSARFSFLRVVGR